MVIPRVAEEKKASFGLFSENCLNRYDTSGDWNDYFIHIK